MKWHARASLEEENSGVVLELTKAEPWLPGGATVHIDKQYRTEGVDEITYISKKDTTPMRLLR